MSTPEHELPQPRYVPPFVAHDSNISTSDEEGTVTNEKDRLNPHFAADKGSSIDQVSHDQSREQEHRLHDDLAMLQAERMVSNGENMRLGPNTSNGVSMHRSRSRLEPVDQFDVNTNPIHEKTAGFAPPENPAGRAAKIFKRIHESSFLIRYFTYIVPLVLVFLIPLLLGALVFRRSTVGTVKLMWFSVWLEILWLTLWGARIVAKALPYPIGVITSLFTNNSKKWKDMTRQLEVPGTLFFWALAVEISFLPIMTNNHLRGKKEPRQWEITMNKIIVSLLVGAVLNFVEKIIIQLIAISFHLRTYADRIEINKFQIGSLVKLYQYSKEKIAEEDSDFEEQGPSQGGSGARTPMQYLNQAQRNAKGFLGKVGDVAGKVAGDFTGRAVTKSTHPRQVVLTLLGNTPGSQVLARRLYRTFVREGAETIVNGDLKHAFETDEEADSAFSMFDKDMNGDISMSELEAVCVEIGRERKSITASLKDLDSVVSKLDSVLIFFVLIATILVALSLLSVHAAGVLTSAGSAVLALSWLFSSTAQEFLASCIFVLVKHPFDCGDRVFLYGNAGSTLKGDDYIVKKISLLYTEFKKMEGQVVQAPNSYLNTLFIMNQRRSGGLAEAVPLTVKFGTSLEQIDELRQRLTDFVKSEKREYQVNILTEIREVVEANAVNLNVIFFYKTNWQNEALRLQRRNKFICAMMMSMIDIGIEGPLKLRPGQSPSNPFYYSSTSGTKPFSSSEDRGNGETHDVQGVSYTSPGVSRQPDSTSDFRYRSGGVENRTRPRGESVTDMAKRMDFSLGMREVSASNTMGDVYEDGQQQARMPSESRSPNRLADARRALAAQEADDEQIARLERGNSRASRFRGLNRVYTAQSNPRSPVPRGSSESETPQKDKASMIHRNRFFSRHGRKHSVSENQDLMEQGIAEIPEQDRLDSRSGLLDAHSARWDAASSIAPVSTHDTVEGSRRRDLYEMRDLGS